VAHRDWPIPVQLDRRSGASDLSGSGRCRSGSTSSVK
jgi:hypothetical protein